MRSIYIGVILFTFLFQGKDLLANRGGHVWVRTVLHKNGTRTVSKQNNSTRVLEQLTYSNKDALTMKRMFQLDRMGRARSGLTFDGKNNLLFRMEYTYDAKQRMRQERVFDRMGEMVRYVVHDFDEFGRKLKPKAVSYPMKAGASPTPVQVARPEIMDKAPDKAVVRETPAAQKPEKKRRGIFGTRK